MEPGIKQKLAQFCDVAEEAVIESRDVDTLYSIPLNLQKQGLDRIVCEHLKLDTPEADMTEWEGLEQRVLNLEGKVQIALVGKYVELPDAYLSVVEALKHSGFVYNTHVDIKWGKCRNINERNT